MAAWLTQHMPFLSEHWPWLMAGVVCMAAVRQLFTLMADQMDKREAQRRNLDEELLGDDELDCDGVDEGAVLGEGVVLGEGDAGPALPWDLNHIPFEFTRITPEESLRRSKEFYETMLKRRTIRFFSDEPVQKEVIRNIIAAAGTAPSGAHTEPWTYVVVSDQEMKKTIREIVQEEEKINYEKRMGKKWTTDLQPLKTSWVKEYLTTAPYLILVFKQMYSFSEYGRRRVHYYNEKSVAIASGILITAVHMAGLVSLTSTPLNCGPALRSLLNRPLSERLALLLPVGYPAADATVPDLARKTLDEILIEI